jgi:dipeptidyl aminopeptidase/acylaminoacyl peptidase
LGGTPQTVVRGIDSDISFSPDGRRIAFAHANVPEAGKYQIIAVNLDGSDPQILHTASPTSDTPSSVAWSPDGKQVALRLSNPTNALGGIGLLAVSNGKISRFASFEDKLTSEFKWLPDGRGILALYAQKGPDYFQRAQIGLIPDTDKPLIPITRDTNSYASLTVSGDGKTLATVQTKTTQNLYVVHASENPSGDPALVLPQGQVAYDFDWTRDGNLVFTDATRLLRAGIGQGAPTRLLSDPGAALVDVAGCATHSLVFSWAFHGGANATNVWRANLDGTSPAKLTDGKNDRKPVCSADEKWVYFWNVALQQLWRVPLDGSAPAEAVAGSSVSGTVPAGAELTLSPDGKLLAYILATVPTPEDPYPQYKIALLDLSSKAAPRLLDADERISVGGLIFNPDGSAIAYPIRENGVDNVWIQPLNGSAGRQVTAFASDQISAFHWSPDGKSLGVLRGHTESDVVLIRDSAQQ